MNFYTLFMFFFIYSIIGWLTEVIYCKIIGGKLTNRGFLNGPYCPIYGFGALIIVLVLIEYSSYPVLVFIIGMILTTILEYITSFLMEKIFNAKWWDYSNMKFNINGRVCLLNSLEFAILGMLLTYVIHPNISIFVLNIPKDYIVTISISLLLLMLVDLGITLYTILNLKEKLNAISEITQEIIKNKKANIPNLDIVESLEKIKEDVLLKTSVFHNRILNAFPEIEFTKRNQELLEIKEKIQNKINSKKKR